MTGERAAQIGEMLIDDCQCNATNLKVRRKIIMDLIYMVTNNF
jgi:hypothetical protein